MSTVKLSFLCEKLNLKNWTEDISIKGINIREPEINRPALQLAGFYAHFDNERVQIIGNVEMAYISEFPKEERAARYELLFGSKIPCVILSRGWAPEEVMLEAAHKYNVPILGTQRTTSEITSSLIRLLQIQLAPCISIHGVLVDVCGEGVLIEGESGIGKSEAALELIKRGHRLVSDDVVEIRRVSDESLIGTAPSVTKYFIELRGIGIIDVKTVFGVGSVKAQQNIDMVIKLEEWNREKDYDRIGLEDKYTEILGKKVICYTIPIRPGRNLAIILESAAINNRQKKMGYNAAQELYKRVQENMMRNREEDED